MKPSLRAAGHHHDPYPSVTVGVERGKETSLFDPLLDFGVVFFSHRVSLVRLFRFAQKSQSTRPEDEINRV
jgi:hypothetical protein